MLNRFIERPVLSTVISIIIVVLGLIGLATLPVEQYPDIAPPTVRVSATYSGANADVVLNSVVIPLEEAINGVEGMTYITSTASNNGEASITVYFEQGINPDIAAVNVQNLAAQANSLLPAEVISTGVTVRKSQNSTLLMLFLYSDNPEYNGRFIQNYANINILPQIQRVSGVGEAQVYGAQNYSMRVWLKPDVMTIYGINPSEVIAALNDQSIEAAPGELGDNSDQAFQYTLKYTGKLQSPEEFGNIILRSENGLVLRVKDIAEVELGSLNYSVLSRFNNKDGVVIAISQTAGSNAQNVIKNVKAELESASDSFPEGINYDYMIDASEFLGASISKVIHTLIEAFILVFIVVFIFLQDIRSTIIPAIAVPVSIIGTFFMLEILGFSVNLLTLFALILAIGIVVDDAIVVVEAVHAELDAGEKDPRKASEEAMAKIAPAIISITLVMAAVFIPVSFIGGTSGVFYKQFGLTMAVAIVISAINALTLSPALCALFLKPHQEGEEHKGFLKRFYYYFNIGFDITKEKYRSSLVFFGKKNHRWIPLVIIAVFGAGLLFLMNTIPSAFIPQEDSGTGIGVITLPPGSSLERSDSIVNQVVEIIREVPEVNDVASISGVNFISGVGSSYATVIFKLAPWGDRSVTVNDVVAQLTQKTKNIHDATFLFFGTPTIQGFGLSSGVTIQLQDRTGGDINKFYGIASEFIGKLNQSPSVIVAQSSFNPNFPQKRIDADIAKIKEAGITLSTVMTTLQAYVGSIYTSTFNLYGKQYWVVVQASPEYRSKESDLDGIYVQTSTGDMAPITEFLTITDITGPQSLSRFNLFTSIDATIIPAPGSSTGDVIELIQQEAANTLPEGYGFDYSGITREEVSSKSQTAIIFALCLIFIYLLLSALYESYILPLSVLLSLPVGLCGLYLFIFIAMMSGTGIVNNTYVQISLIMLIGLLSKNAILIVEYAIQRHQEGMSVVDSAIEGAMARLRPILMTSFAFIFGLMPLAFSSGAGAVGNKSIGISAIGGMLVGTIFGVLVIPVLYILFQSLQNRFSRSGKKEEEPINP